MIDIIDAIHDNQSFVITSHKTPDGDAIGSSIALGLALKKLGKKINYIIEKPSDKFNFLKDLKEIREELNQSERFDIGIFLDSSNSDHLYNRSVISNCNLKINIDHHVTNSKYGDINYIDSRASATGEIVYDLIKKLNVSLDEDIANALYTAIVTDTGNFKYDSVTDVTHLIVSDLYKYSQFLPEINKKIYDQHEFSKIKIIGKAINNLYLVDDIISVIYLTLDDLKDFPQDEDTEGIINCARDIKGVEVAIFIRESKENEYRISFRSKREYDVSKLATFYGGGGHSKAAGCTIEGNSIKDIADKIVKRIKAEL